MNGMAYTVGSNGMLHRGGRGGRIPTPGDRSGFASGTSGDRSTFSRVRFPDESNNNNSNQEEPMALTKILSFVIDAIQTILALVCCAGLMTIVVVLFLTVRPFSQSVYRRLAAQLGGASFLDAIALLLPNTKIYLTGDSDVPSPVGTSILVSNHVHEHDWWWVLLMGRCVGLRGSLKVFLRNEYLQLSMNHSTNGDTFSTANGRSSGALTKSNSSPRVVSFSRVESSGSGSPSSNGSTSSAPGRRKASYDVSLGAKLLHLFLEFPLMNGGDYVSDREQLFHLLRSFAANSGGTAPVHLLLFPEGWSLHNGADRTSIHAMSNEFANREGRPQLKHLLLPRNRGFKASLECLRESSPVVYDVTIAYHGYGGELPVSSNFSLYSLWESLRSRLPREVHLRVKRYSMEEVLQDSAWMDKKWSEKDRYLSHFTRYQSFPMDARGYRRPRIFDTRHHSLESSLVALGRLLLIPCTVPILLLLSIPLFWALLWIWLVHRAVLWLLGAGSADRGENRGGPDGTNDTTQTPGSVSATVTPFCPTTPFVSPSIATWRDMLPGHAK